MTSGLKIWGFLLFGSTLAVIIAYFHLVQEIRYNITCKKKSSLYIENNQAIGSTKHASYYNLEAMKNKSYGITERKKPNSSFHTKESMEKASYHIYYLKVHKTGSSTMANILHRIAANNRLYMVAFIAAVDNISNWQGVVLPHPLDFPINTTHKELTGDKYNHPIKHKYDMHVRHSLFNETNIQTFMKKDTKLIATCRHPMKRTMSAFYFKGYNHKFKQYTLTNQFEYFLQNTNKFQKSKLKNTMAREFGMDVRKALSNNSYADEYIKYLGATLHQVIITDLYDESLVLLKRKLGWDMKTILHISFKNITYANKYNESKLRQYDELFGKELENYTPLDYKIYNYFLKVHNFNVEREGMLSLKQEVNIYQN